MTLFVGFQGAANPPTNETNFIYLVVSLAEMGNSTAVSAKPFPGPMLKHVGVGQLVNMQNQYKTKYKSGYAQPINCQS